MSDYSIAIKIAGQLEGSFSNALKSAQSGLSGLGTSHPASDIYSNACADSVAVFEVVRPISMAAASSFLYSSAVAFAVAAVDDIAASNSFPVAMH